VARQILRHTETLDLANFVCAFHLGGMPHAMVERSIQAFASEVMPRVAARTPATAEA
jgi:hypothetical protein